MFDKRRKIKLKPNISYHPFLVFKFSRGVNTSLKTKLITLFILVMVVPLSVVSIITYDNLAVSFRGTMEQLSSHLLEATNSNILHYSKSIETPLVTGSRMQIIIDCADSPDSILNSPDKMLELSLALKSIKDSSPIISDVYFVTDSGFVTRYPNKIGNNDMAKFSRYYQEMDWYKRSLEDTLNATWSKPYKRVDEDVTMISSAIGVITHSHKAVVFAEVNLTRFASAAVGVIPLGEEGYILAMLSDGEVVQSKNQNLIGTKIFPKDVIKKMGALDKGFIPYKSKEGNALLLFSTDQALSWKVIGYIPEAEFYRESNKIGILILILSFVCIAIGVCIAVFFSMRITKPIQSLQAMMSQVAQGKVGLNLNIKASGEIGDMIDGFNSMLTSIRELIKGVKKASAIVTESSEQIQISNKGVIYSGDMIGIAVSEVASGASSQAEEAESSLNSIKSLSDGINEISGNTYTVNVSLGRISKVVNDGLVASEEMKEKSEINYKMSTEIVKKILALDNDLRQVDFIVKTITSIAEQTNLLSLNAAIEAARAGNSGKGFAVVAEEVRKLAESSKLSVQSISTIISGIKGEMSHIVKKAVVTGETAKEQMESLTKFSTVYVDISQAVDNAVKEFEKILSYMGKMNKDKENVVKNVESVSAISEEFAATAEEISASIEDQVTAIKGIGNLIDGLKVLSEELTHSVSKFEV